MHVPLPPTEVYRGPEVSFTEAVKHIRYRGHENHRLTERTLAETDPGAADFITSHKNLMQPLEDLERGMGVPEENKPYMEQYHGDEDYASIHAMAKELRVVVEAAAPAAAAAASIPP
eukprot:jgi/Tetstr1/425540/TSEL_015963.t1